MELDCLTHLHLITHRDGPGLGVGAEDSADQEVALAPLSPVFVDDHSHVHALGEQLPVLDGQRRRQFLKACHRCAPAQLVDHASLGPGDGVGVTDWSASLRNQQIGTGSSEAGPDGALRQHPAVEKEAALPHCQSAACHPAGDHGPRDVLVQVGQQVTGRERERVTDH